ncbi:hypothetical protein G5I_14654 [Acromyrmex echinatior]|uniref:Uncharacterized protein n=1 Tax=Acromyrmex echinatior TaxID=103372 RepID=F4X8B4_ACREC|nr:hypothetical protein G5I_14654 [Acromyrmex echinatior]
MTGRLSRDTGPIVELARAREPSVAIVIPASVRSHARARECALVVVGWLRPLRSSSRRLVKVRARENHAHQGRGHPPFPRGKCTRRLRRRRRSPVDPAANAATKMTGCLDPQGRSWRYEGFHEEQLDDLPSRLTSRKRIFFIIH